MRKDACDRCGKEAKITSYLNGRKRLCLDCYKDVLDADETQYNMELHREFNKDDDQYE